MYNVIYPHFNDDDDYMYAHVCMHVYFANLVARKKSDNRGLEHDSIDVIIMCVRMTTKSFDTGLVLAYKHACVCMCVCVHAGVLACVYASVLVYVCVRVCVCW